MNVAETMTLAATGHIQEAKDALGGAITEVARGEEASALARASGVGLVVVWEADGLLGRLAALEPRVPLAPLGGAVARALGMEDGAKAKRRLEKAARRGRLDAPATPSLRVAISSEPAQRIAWSVATGLAADVVRDGVQAMGTALASQRGLTLTKSEREPARVVFDGTPSSPTSWIIMSALERGELGLTFAPNGPRKRAHDDATSLAAAITKARVPLSSLIGGKEVGERFERADLDGMKALSIDGAYVEFAAASVVTVTTGPRAALARA